MSQTAPPPTDFELAVARLRNLANNPKTPAAVAGDLALVLLAATAYERPLALAKDALTKVAAEAVGYYRSDFGTKYDCEQCERVKDIAEDALAALDTKGGA